MSDRAAVDWDRFRAYLSLVARQNVSGDVAAKADLSGIVQQTLLDAHRHAAIVEGLGPEQRMAWLRRALANNLADEIRRMRAQQRDVNRERSLEGALEQSALHLANWLAVEQTTPSIKVEKHERLLQLAEAIAALPDAQRLAIEQHYFQAKPVAEVAQNIGRSLAATAGLLKRGLQQLRELLNEREK